MLNGLGVAHTDLSQYAEAIACHQQALALERAAGDRSGQAWNLNNLGVALCDLGRSPGGGRLLPPGAGPPSGLARPGPGLEQPRRHLPGARSTGPGAWATSAGPSSVQGANGDHAAQRYTCRCLGDVYVALASAVRAIEHYRRPSRQVARRVTAGKSPSCLRGSRTPWVTAARPRRCRQEAGMILDDLRGGPKTAEDARADEAV